jgi:CP family cyanate transporter-like MFS transporter
MTFAMSIGVALAQLAIPSLVAVWEGGNVGRATAVYGNGMLVGEIAGASATGTLLLSLAAGSWETALALWSLPVLAVAVALAFQPEGVRQGLPVEWWPQWRDPRVWIIGLTFGAASLAYWGANAHLPDYLSASGHGSEVPLALGSLNALQLPSSFALGAWPALFLVRRWPFVSSGVVTVACVLGLAVSGGAGSAAWAGALGLVAALVFLLALALPPMLVPREEVHRFSAAVFSVSYTFAFLGALIAGVLWDATGVPAAALAPIGFAGLVMIVLGWRIGAPRISTTLL